MKKYIEIEGVPSLIQGEESHKVLLAVHGLMSNKEHPICWNHNTCILWGNKDDMMPEHEIDTFANHFHATVDKVDSEHYFHTEEQLELLQKWIELKI